MTDSLLQNRAEVRARHIPGNLLPFGSDFAIRIPALVRELAGTLELHECELDRSIASLEVIERALHRVCTTRAAMRGLLPSLVAYVGEVLIESNGGSWYMLWRPDFALWEPYVVSESGEFCDPFTHLYEQLGDLDRGFSLLAAIGRMTEEAGL